MRTRPVPCVIAALLLAGVAGSRAAELQTPVRAAGGPGAGPGPDLSLSPTGAGSEPRPATARSRAQQGYVWNKSRP